MSNCQKYIEQMNMYLDGELKTSMIGELLQHISECPSCNKRFESLKIITFEMRDEKNIQAPSNLHASIMQHVRTSAPKYIKSRKVQWVINLGLVAAVFLFVFSGAVKYMKNTYIFDNPNAANTANIAASLSLDEGPEAVDEPMQKAALRSAEEPQSDDNIKKDDLKKNEDTDSGSTKTPFQIFKSGLIPGSAELKQKAGVDTDLKEPDTTAEASVALIDEIDNRGIEPTKENLLAENIILTDEAFSFYNLYKGELPLPSFFSNFSTIFHKKENITYIYIPNNEKQHTEAKRQLAASGFTLQEKPENMPENESNAEFGLAIIVHEKT